MEEAEQTRVNKMTRIWRNGSQSLESSLPGRTELSPIDVCVSAAHVVSSALLCFVVPPQNAPAIRSRRFEVCSNRALTFVS